jgi:hypothetical protein
MLQTKVLKTVRAQMTVETGGLDACGISSDVLGKTPEIWQLLFNSGVFF